MQGENRSIQVERLIGLGSVSRLGHQRPGEPRRQRRHLVALQGVRTKRDYLRFEKRISEVRSLADRTNDVGCGRLMIGCPGRRGGFFRELTSRLLHLYWNFASHLVKTLHQIDVSAIYSGYPFNTPPTRVTSLRQTRALAADRCRWSSIKPRSTA